ncbi:putative Histidine kinase [Georgfuchsia toluolica]|uniref:histidine kinase n=1 Tax=Georgfuchsia toluolica TaxID=424218 RepID=A0A916J5Q7_9PROT|nr:HAMP domain-containing sensor histidine kinase [Georgfuchsia toluolica]CAG4884729.1 putative Histidine kinase [Georgfuchsia toluolica]
MDAAKSLSKRLLAQPVPRVGAVAVVVSLLAAYLDWTTWLELNIPVIYGLPLVLSLATRNRRLLWGMTAFLLITTFVVYSLQIAPGRFSPVEPFFIDRLLAAAAVLVIAWLLHHRMAVLDTMEAQRRMLSLQNQEIDRRRREAEEASERKSRLLASASHDIGAPLYAITLMAEVIRQAAGNPSLATQIPELAERVKTNAASLEHLISDLLDVARLDSGCIEVRESAFSLNDLLVEQCSNLLPLAQAKNLRLEVDTPERPINLQTDRVKLARVVTNLLANAIKFTQNGGVVVSAGVMMPEQVLIRVRDTGVGIAAEHLDHIFDEFARLQNAQGDHSEGWGLGLPICRRLIEALGGTITVESKPGQGSIFIACLPSRCLLGGSGTVASRGGAHPEAPGRSR